MASEAAHQQPDRCPIFILFSENEPIFFFISCPLPQTVVEILLFLYTLTYGFWSTK